MEKVIEIAKNVAIVILALIVAFILFIGLGKLASFAFSSLASAGASLTSVFVPATTTPVVVGANPPANSPDGSYAAPGTYSTSSATMTIQSQPTTQTTGTSAAQPSSYSAPARTTTYVAPRVSYYGLPDLSVTVISTGIVNSAGVFIPQSVVYEGQRAAAEILVTNVGTNVSGQWTLQAPLPTNEGGEVFTSYPQASLTPGSSAKLTLAFNDLRDVSISSMVVTVDPYNQIVESNKANNQTVVTFQKSVAYNTYGVNGYSAGYGYTYPTTYPVTTTYTNYSNTDQNASVYYSNGSYYIAPNNSYNNSYNNYPYTTYDGNWNSSSYLPDLIVSIVGVTNNPNTYTSYTSNSAYNTCTTNSYGYWNGYTGSSCNNNSNFYDQQRTVQIQVTNIGQSVASNYTFAASVNGTNEYTSPAEPSLAPGQSATYSVNLNDMYSGNATVMVTVNPYNTILESNYSNNSASQTF